MLNLRYKNRNLQTILWEWDEETIRDHWAFKFWHWPSGKTRRQVKAAGLINFGFRALSLGPLEFRYWPNSPKR